MACIFFRMNVYRRRANGAVAQVLLNVVNRGAVLGLVRGSCMPQPMRRGSPYPRGFGTVLLRSEEHTSEIQSLMRTSYAVFCFKKKHKDSAHTPASVTTANH